MSSMMGNVTNAFSAGTRMAAVREPDVSYFQDDLRESLRSAADALFLSVRYLLHDGESVAETIPDCDALAAGLEAKARAFLLQPQFAQHQVGEVTRAMKCAADLRCIARGSREAAYLSKLIMADPDGAGAMGQMSSLHSAICSLGSAVAALTRETTAALDRDDGRAAVSAAAAYRTVDNARAKAEGELRAAAVGLPRNMRRVFWAITWSVAVAAESMTRITARCAFTA